MDGNSLTTGGKSLQFFKLKKKKKSSPNSTAIVQALKTEYFIDEFEFSTSVNARMNSSLHREIKKEKKKEKETSPVPANQFGKRSFVFSFLFFFLSFLLSLEKNPLTTQKDFLIYVRNNFAIFFATKNRCASNRTLERGGGN